MKKILTIEIDTNHVYTANHVYAVGKLVNVGALGHWSEETGLITGVKTIGDGDMVDADIDTDAKVDILFRRVKEVETTNKDLTRAIDAKLKHNEQGDLLSGHERRLDRHLGFIAKHERRIEDVFQQLAAVENRIKVVEDLVKKCLTPNQIRGSLGRKPMCQSLWLVEVGSGSWFHITVYGGIHVRYYTTTNKHLATKFASKGEAMNEFEKSGIVGTARYVAVVEDWPI